jgi:hypothetical protein
VQRIKAETKTASGIFLPESSVKELNEGKVLAVGPGALNKEGARLPMGVTVGDRVLIPQVGFVPEPFAATAVAGHILLVTSCWPHPALIPVDMSPR